MNLNFEIEFCAFFWCVSTYKDFLLPFPYLHLLKSSRVNPFREPVDPPSAPRLQNSGQFPRSTRPLARGHAHTRWPLARGYAHTRWPLAFSYVLHDVGLCECHMPHCYSAFDDVSGPFCSVTNNTGRPLALCYAPTVWKLLLNLPTLPSTTCPAFPAGP